MLASIRPVVPRIGLGCRALTSSTLRLATKAPEKPYTSSTAVGGDVNNVKSETNRLEKTLQRFWGKADAAFEEEARKWVVRLDGKPLKTPLGHKLAIPERKEQLALLVAHEWDTLVDLKIKPTNLPLTSLTSRAADLEAVFLAEKADPDMITKLGDLQDVKHDLLRYLDTDTCLIFATEDEYDGKLRKRQKDLYEPLIEEYNSFFTEFGRQNNLLPSEDYKVQLQTLDCETDGIRGNSQTATDREIVLGWLDKLPLFDLVSLEKAILTSKSFLCGASILRSNATDESTAKDVYQPNKANESEYFFKDVEEITELGNLETIFQTNEWGEVEDTHDVDQADWSRSLSAAALVCR
ncbi:hypothetical protein FT663_02149 [Candidozyma haemuli var. vulneris]|uniref:Uncharacterized protein n=1 Tax=Candidozyma haemuli TaxID=45357 RepID=A0A2V1AKM7_9ASCO|nr:hypothetical protein CXQ85_001157 [[Candida] haemuloni]KAF3990408.1 hypothetical protein FT662_02302 [[Candida] haemuloni var. vulneris]KAF3992840.1 hypothetical protein FT663_02149 [[Candida] haemuloni var. vulneris]PVH18867.1 hypothetical protein CXQ85_001157 [[Candida] haemuloni]